MAMHFLSIKDISDEYGIPLGTLKTWLRRKTVLPPADVSVGAGGGQATTLGWARETVDAWHAARE